MNFLAARLGGADPPLRGILGDCRYSLVRSAALQRSAAHNF